jgi:hypothetical protein
MQAIFDADPRPSAFLPVREAIRRPGSGRLCCGRAPTGWGLLAAIPDVGAVWAAWGDAVGLVSQQSEAPDAAFRNAAEQIRAAASPEIDAHFAARVGGSQGFRPSFYLSPLALLLRAALPGVARCSCRLAALRPAPRWRATCRQPNLAQLTLPPLP